MAMGISRMACPHCEGVVHAVKTRPLSRLFKEITYMCRNPDCGHVFVAGLFEGGLAVCLAVYVAVFVAV